MGNERYCQEIFIISSFFMTGKSVTHVASLLTLDGVLHNYLQGYSSPLSASRTLKLISPRGTPYCIKEIYQN